MTDWHIMTRSRGGLVSLLKNLDEDTARQTCQRIGHGVLHQGDPWSDNSIAQRIMREEGHRLLDIVRKRVDASGKPEMVRLPSGEEWLVQPGGQMSGRGHGGIMYMSSTSDGELVQIECWGPEGAAMEVWPKPDDYEARFAKARQAQELVRQVNEEMGV